MKAFFVGSRCAVFDAAAAAGIEFANVLVPEGSPFHEKVSQTGHRIVSLRSKPQLIEAINTTDFDVLISNGCPYIIPVSALKKPGQKFVNVHPSLLPNLRGKHPVNGAILFGQPLGASCHVMDDDIDTGEVIARVHVDFEAGVDVALLYRLAFLAEGDAFRKAYERNFVPGKDELRRLSGGNLYFSRTPEALSIDFRDPLDLTVRRVQAFSVPGQMARFTYNDHEFVVSGASRVESNYLERKFAEAPSGTVIFKYDASMVIKLNDGFIRLFGIAGSLELLQEGSNLMEAGFPTIQGDFSESRRNDNAQR